MGVAVVVHIILFIATITAAVVLIFFIIVIFHSIHIGAPAIYIVSRLSAGGRPLFFFYDFFFSDKFTSVILNIQYIIIIIHGVRHSNTIGYAAGITL